MGMTARIARKIDPKALRRVKALSDSDLKTYMVNTAMSLGAMLDLWMYHDGPEEEVTLSVDALLALWSEIESRGMVR